MRAAATASYVLFFGAIYMSAQTKGADMKWEKFDRLCGRLEYVDSVPANRKKTYFVERRTALSKVQLDLFRADNDETCCSGLSFVRSEITKRNGVFDFGTIDAGTYLVVAHWKGNASSTRVSITAERNDKRGCSEQGLDIDDKGRIQKFQTITVD